MKEIFYSLTSTLYQKKVSTTSFILQTSANYYYIHVSEMHFKTAAISAYGIRLPVPAILFDGSRMDTASIVSPRIISTQSHVSTGFMPLIHLCIYWLGYI